MTKRLLAIFAALLLAGCFKDVSNETAYILKPLVQEKSGDLVTPFEGAVAYAFDADTTQWTVASYDDALQGIITNRAGTEQANFYAVSSPYVKEGATGWTELLLSKPEQMVLVVDPASRRYAYTQQKLPENLPQMYVSLVFRLWKEGKSYLDGKWSFYNEFYSKPVLLDMFVDAAVQNGDGADREYLASSRMNVYAYAADTTQWCIASYDDARVGAITSKSDPELQRTTPSFQGYRQSGSDLYKITVSDPTLMVVVVNQLDRMYAYTKCVVDLEGESPTLSMTFRPWEDKWKSEEEGWVIVDESLAPSEDEKENEDE